MKSGILCAISIRAPKMINVLVLFQKTTFIGMINPEILIFPLAALIEASIMAFLYWKAIKLVFSLFSRDN